MPRNWRHGHSHPSSAPNSTACFISECHTSMWNERGRTYIISATWLVQESPNLEREWKKTRGGVNPKAFQSVALLLESHFWLDSSIHVSPSVSPRHLKINCLKNPVFLSHKLLSLLLRNLYLSTFFHILSGRKCVAFITKNSFKSALTFSSPVSLILSTPLSYLTYYSHFSLFFFYFHSLCFHLPWRLQHPHFPFKLNDSP